MFHVAGVWIPFPRLRRAGDDTGGRTVRLRHPGMTASGGSTTIILDAAQQSAHMPATLRGCRVALARTQTPGA